MGYVFPFLTEYTADIYDHVNFGATFIDCFDGFVYLDVSRGIAMGKGNDRADLDLIRISD